MADCGCEMKARNAAERKTLRLLLAVNAMMFVLEMITGLLAHSTALLADSLDMLADATVYGISLAAVGGTKGSKIRAALMSGVFQITLAVLVLVDVVRRFVWGSDPEPFWMMGIGAIAFLANVCCLFLISKHRQGDVHMRASWIFSRNDVIANLGVIVAGVLVLLFHSRLPDLIMGLLITGLVLRGGIDIIRDAKAEQHV
ncbi:cation transporter [Oscillatoria sp. FACHB-1407]|uniref:cation transporter n=1 Tax=Oscillatoria sp. FACHB-1407 TaxID=2692847 RepID=UPI001686E3AF|nr:cation transporter [Oscillatoria sp. FACHB-1407]MBD2465477.1 cation transporter [Oscillatoria sp. FACHB-1407]